jgi:SagB-type dehydrogenase family enzyme
LRASGGRSRAPVPPLYRRSPHLVFYWKDGTLVAHNYASRTRLEAQPVVCDVLHFFDRWRSCGDLLADKPRLRQSDLLQLLDLLVQRSLLMRSDRAPHPSERLMAMWRDWNPAAGLFHHSTQDLEYADLDTIEQMTRAKARTTPMPDPVKRHPHAKVYPLPRSTPDGAFADAVLARRTWRRFGRQPVPLKEFATLIGLTAGVQSWLSGTNGQRVPLKTSPSGGARHSIETYVVVRNVSGLPRGLYHYSSDRHAMELLTSRIRRRPIETYLPTQHWFGGAAALLLFTAVFARVQWRYSHARAYRAALIEAGHLCQTFCLTATSLGLAPFCSMALADSRIESDLGIDGISESVLYAAGVGSRASGLGWTRPNTLGRAPRAMTERQRQRFPGQIRTRR